jgi:trehalose utilization protein
VYDYHVLVWSEGTAPDDGAAYPNDVNAAVAEHLNEREAFVARTVSIDDPEQGVTPAALEWADAVVWWGHRRHDDVTDATVDRIESFVTEGGGGLLALHSAHYARPFLEVIGASGDLGEVHTVEGESEHVAVEAPEHPVAEGVAAFEVPQAEMFGEPFDVPEPDTVVFRSTFSEGGEFRSGCAWSFGAGRVFYFRPGHETFRTYHQPEVRAVVANATRWVAGAD